MGGRLLWAIGLGAFVALPAALALGGCSSSDDVTTDDSSEIDESRGELDKDLAPPLPVPATPLIGARLDDVYAQAIGNLVAGAPQKRGDDCSLVQVKNAKGTVVVERETCTTAETVRILGAVTTEHVDLNKDGKVDRWTGADGAVSQYDDTNCDGQVDVIVEDVTKVKDFSLTGYGESLPKSDFLFRIREDRDHDGKLDHEKLTAKGALPPKT
jgi:hypothetical protein